MSEPAPSPSMTPRCAPHGLALGPEGQCVLCRRDSAPPPEPSSRRRAAALVGALALAVAAFALTPRLRTLAQVTPGPTETSALAGAPRNGVAIVRPDRPVAPPSPAHRRVAAEDHAAAGEPTLAGEAVDVSPLPERGSPVWGVPWSVGRGRGSDGAGAFAAARAEPVVFQRYRVPPKGREAGAPPREPLAVRAEPRPRRAAVAGEPAQGGIVPLSGGLGADTPASSAPRWIPPEVGFRVPRPEPVRGAALDTPRRVAPLAPAQPPMPSPQRGWSRVTASSPAVLAPSSPGLGRPTSAVRSSRGHQAVLRGAQRGAVQRGVGPSRGVSARAARLSPARAASR